jgi:hypothetical protein
MSNGDPIMINADEFMIGVHEFMSFGNDRISRDSGVFSRVCPFFARCDLARINEINDLARRGGCLLARA